jgi:branched-subunit amino acid aminotransferase/4-amino-4-deoxychorismate lyase
MPQPSAAIHRPRPDVSAGIIETFLVFEGRPVELEAHMARLRTSARILYAEDPEEARELVLKRARGAWLGRMRLTVEPAPGGGLEPTVVVAAFDPDNVFPTGEFCSSLLSVTVDRGYGEHKWADRALLSQTELDAGPGTVPLLLDEDGTVLETSRANVFAIRDGRLLTPPLDGGILPGIARAAVLELAAENHIEAAEEGLDLAALRESDEVFLTGSLRGVEPIKAIDSEALTTEGPVTQLLAAALRQRWFGAWT